MKEELRQLLEKAAKHIMTPKEIYEQKVSWIYGQLIDVQPEITKEEIKDQLKKLGVVDPDTIPQYPTGIADFPPKRD